MPMLGNKAFEWVKIVNPDDDSMVIAAPRFTGVATGDSKTDNQERVWLFKNSPEDARSGRVITVTHKQRKSADDADDESQRVRYEQIEKIASNDSKTDNQENIMVLDQANFETLTSFVRQRYYVDPANKDDSGSWVEFVRPANYSVVDSKSDNQETVYIFEWNQEDEPAPEDFPADASKLPDALNEETGGVRMDPLQIVANVQWARGDFVLFGWEFSNVNFKYSNFVYTSKDGFTWTRRLAPPDPATAFSFDVVMTMTYGAGRWLAITALGKVYYSVDLMKTWTKFDETVGLFANFSVDSKLSPMLAWGHPRDSVDPVVAKNGVFIYGDITGLIYVSKDKGEHWTTTNMNLGGEGSSIVSVNFFLGKFYVIINDFITPAPGGIATVATLRLLTSTDGVAWTQEPLFSDISNTTVSGEDVGYVGAHRVAGIAYDSVTKSYGFAAQIVMAVSLGGNSIYLGSSTDGVIWTKTAGLLGDWQIINEDQGGITHYAVGWPAMGGGRFLTSYSKAKTRSSEGDPATGEWGVVIGLSGRRIALREGPTVIVGTEASFTSSPSACAFSGVGADRDKGYVGTFVVIEQMSANPDIPGSQPFFRIWWSKDGQIVVDTGNSPYQFSDISRQVFVQGLVIGPTPKPPKTQ